VTAAVGRLVLTVR